MARHETGQREIMGSGKTAGGFPSPCLSNTDCEPIELIFTALVLHATEYDQRDDSRGTSEQSNEFTNLL